MPYKELRRENMDQFRILSQRYFELCPNLEKSRKIYSALVTMNYAHQDIKALYERYIAGSINIDSFYHLMVKVDILRETYKEIGKFLEYNLDKLYGDKKVNSRKTIDRFVAIRSVSLAHPQNTNRHKEYGFDGNLWLEDVRNVADMNYRFYRDEFSKDADFVMFLVRVDSNNDTKFAKDEKRGINLDNDVFNVVRVVEASFEKLNNFLSKQIEEEESKLRKTQICITDELNDADFKLLFKETKKRYPSFVDDHEDENYAEWPLKNVQQLLDFVAKESYGKNFEPNLRTAVYEYHSWLQEMKFETWDETFEMDNIRKLLFPSLDILAIKSGQKFEYEQSKIYSYLSRSDSISIPQCLLGYQRDFSNSSFGVELLIGIVKQFPEFDFKFYKNNQDPYTDRELYFQFVIKVFYYNNEHECDEDVQTAIKKIRTPGSTTETIHFKI